MKLGRILTIIVVLFVVSATAEIADARTSVSIHVSSGHGHYRPYSYRSYGPYVYRRPVYRHSRSRYSRSRIYIFPDDRKTRQIALGANIGLGIADMIMQDRQHKREVELEKKRIEAATKRHEYYDRYHRYQNR